MTIGNMENVAIDTCNRQNEVAEQLHSHANTEAYV